MERFEPPVIEVAVIADIVTTDDDNELPGVGSDNSVGGLG